MKLILILTIMSFCSFAQTGKKSLYVAFDTVKEFATVGTSDSGVDFSSTNYSEDMGRAIGYEHWVKDDVSIFFQHDLKRDIDFFDLVAPGVAAAAKADDSDFSILRLGANYHFTNSEHLDLFAGINFSKFDVTDSKADLSTGLQAGIAAEKNRFRFSLLWTFNYVELEDETDSNSPYSYQSNNLYLSIGYLL